MSAPSRFPNGLGNSAGDSSMGMLGLPDPTKFHSFMEDFDNYTATDWTITTSEAGSGSATEVIQNEDGGVLKLTNAAGNDDHDFLQYSGNTSSATVETFLFEAGKKMFFKSRMKISDADSSEFVMGLQITDTSPIDASDGIWFSLEGGVSTDIKLNVVKSSSIASSTVTTAIDDTYVTLAFYYDGVDSVEAFANDVRQTSIGVTNLPDDEELSVSFGVQNTGAAAKTMSIDYIFVAKER